MALLDVGPTEEGGVGGGGEGIAASTSDAGLQSYRRCRRERKVTCRSPWLVRLSPAIAGAKTPGSPRHHSPQNSNEPANHRRETAAYSSLSLLSLAI